jgi:hypothetical protein
MRLMTFVTSVDPGQPAHWLSLIRVYTVRYSASEAFFLYLGNIFDYLFRQFDLGYQDSILDGVYFVVIISAINLVHLHV